LIRPIKQLLQPYVTMSAPLLAWSLFSLPLALLFLAFSNSLYTPLRFIWNCFIKPFTPNAKHDASEQQDRLEAFYSGQADLYDSTRTHLLKGRETMLQLLASHLKVQPVPTRVGARKPKIWVDIGGGTGWNIEKM